jgi:hypothetical protein
VASNGLGYANVYDISREPSNFLGLSETLLADALARHQTTGAHATRQVPRLGTTPRLTALSLGVLVETAATFDIGPFLRQQAVVAFGRGESMQRVFVDLALSYADLQRAFAPGLDLAGDRWLFLAFCRAIDQRVLAHLQVADPRTLPMTIGLDVLGLDGEGMRLLEAIARRLIGRRFVISVPHLAALADLGSYLAACARLKAMGFSICLDGLTTPCR